MTIHTIMGDCAWCPVCGCDCYMQPAQSTDLMAPGLERAEDDEGIRALLTWSSVFSRSDNDIFQVASVLAPVRNETSLDSTQYGHGQSLRAEGLSSCNRVCNTAVQFCGAADANDPEKKQAVQGEKKEEKTPRAEGNDTFYHDKSCVRVLEVLALMFCRSCPRSRCDT